MVKNDFFFPSSDGTHQLHGKEWLPDEGNLRAVLQLAHGIAEYIARYDGLGEYLAEKGVAVIGCDHLGHGGSLAGGEEPGFAGEKDGWLNIVEDVERLRAATAERFPGKPYFMMGHSMGSFIMRDWAIMHPVPIAGLILSGTGAISAPLVSVGLAVCRGQCRRTGPRGRSGRLKKLMFGSYNKRIDSPKSPNAWLNTDQEAVARYDADPLCGFDPTIALCGDLLHMIGFMGRRENAAKMNRDVPVYLFAGVDDPVGGYGKGVESSARLFKQAGVKDVSLRLYPGMRHETLNEPDRAAVMEELYAWLEKRL